MSSPPGPAPASGAIPPPASRPDTRPGPRADPPGAAPRATQPGARPGATQPGAGAGATQPGSGAGATQPGAAPRNSQSGPGSQANPPGLEPHAGPTGPGPASRATRPPAGPPGPPGTPVAAPSAVRGAEAGDAAIAAAWQEYQAAAGRLGEVRREGARAAAERDTAIQVARQELVAVYRRVLLQRSRIVDAATRRGAPVPPLVGAPADVAAALATMTVAPPVPEQGRPRGSAHAAFATARAMAPEMISGALRGATTTLDTADALLFRADAVPRSTGRRNAAVYGGYTALLTLAQIPLLVALLRERPGGMFALCGLVLPLLAFALGWLTIGVAFREPAGGRVRRDPVLGIAISLVSALPMVVLLLSALVSAIRG